MLKKAILILLISTFISCTKTVPIEITLVFTKKVENKSYPDYISDIIMPFKSTECENDIILKPINVSRIDINNKIVKTNAWHFENMGENTVEFSKNWLKPYFKDSLPPNILFSKSKEINKNKIDKFISKKSKKNNIFIFSENSDLENYNGIRVLNTPKEVNQAISKVTCKEGDKKIMVLINPFFGEDKNDDTDIIVETTIGKDVKEPIKVSISQKKVTKKTSNSISSDGVKWSKVKNDVYRSNYARYYGGLKNGKMDGSGTMVFIKSHLIPVPKSSEKRITVKSGYKLTGVFKNGSFVSGSLVDRNGGNKKAIFIGR